MKKLLALLLLSPLAFAEDEFPIELTCEIGASIVYFNINETTEDSWWTPHQSHQFKSKWTATFFNNKAFKDKKNNNFSKFNISDGQIFFELRGINLSANVFINRYTLAVDGASQSGQCFKGFKEYEKQI